MAQENLAPDAILTITDCSPNDVTYVQDDPDSPDANWIVADNNNVAPFLSLSFPTPVGTLTGGANVQTVQVLVRQFDEGQSGTPRVDIDVIDGTDDDIVGHIGSPNNVPTGGVLFNITFNADEVIDPANLRVEITATKTGGGPGARNTVDIGAVQWEAIVDETGTTFEQSVVGSMPASSGTATTITTFGELVEGSMPASSGTLVKLISKGMAGDMPTSSGVVLKQTQTVLDGSMPSTTGTVGASLTFTQTLSGVTGAITGAVNKLISLSPSGILPAAAGAITKLIGKGVAGTFGSSAGTLTKNTNKLVSGDMPEASGITTASLSFVASIAGIMGNMAGILDAQLAAQQFGQAVSGVFGAITGSVTKLIMPATLTGNMPASTGVISKFISKIVGGDNPEPTGTVTPSVLLIQAVSGIMGAITGIVGAIKTGKQKVLKIIGSCFRKFIQ
jgi:hypothetical protein